MDKKQFLRDFYAEFFNGHDLAAAAKYVRPDYIQHNPKVGQGLDGLVEFFTERFKVDPSFHVEIQDIMVDGDLAAIRLHNIAADGHVQAWVADFYRFEGDKLAEHWDVLQFIG